MLQLDQLTQSVKEHLKRLDRNINHKWIVTESSLGGRGLVSTEDIQPGEIIYVDHPLIHGPRAGSLSQRGCTVCRKIDREEFLKCDKCALLVCSEICLNSETHLDDCSVISSWIPKIRIEEVDDLVMLKALTPIRSLLLDPQRRLFLSSLQIHANPRHGFEVRDIKEFFEFSAADEVFMILTCRVLDANAYEIASSFGKDEMSLRGLYPVAGLMNHACVPNTRHSFDKENNMTVKATKFIAAGSEISTCYSGLLWGTPARRHHLDKTKHFLCTCDRCADPTEFGTNLAALACFVKDCKGFLLPKNPLNFTSSWHCVECSITIPSKHVGCIQSALGSLMGTMDFGNPEQVEDFVRARLLKYIPRSNQIYLDIECRLIWLFGGTSEYHLNELSESRLTLKESLCREVLRTVAALGAGDAHLRGLLLYHLHAALAERARRRPDLYEELKPEIESTIDQAYNILEGDISAPLDLQLRRKYLGSGCDKPVPEKLLILRT